MRIRASRGILGILRTTPVLLLAACAVNPATGARELSLIGEGSEIQMGRESDAQVTAAYGLVDDADLQSYVSDLGTRLAAVSERPNLPWTFKVVDDPTVNAFALPGGFIYVTRGILARFDSEAELAGVLGHEIGHVTARHSVTQLSRQRLQQAVLGVGMVLSETVARYGQVGAAAFQVLNLSYSRGDETESDMLGLRYITRVGYDPDAMIGVFQMLARAGDGDGGGRLPEWQSTHPYPENREADIRARIAESNAPDGGTVARDAFLDVIDGIVYGENPREGYFEGPRFLHPDLAFELTFPAGWTTVNQRTVVAAVSPAEDAVVALEVAEEDASPGSALRDFLSDPDVRGGPVEEDDAGGIERARAPFDISASGGEYRGEVAFVRMDDVTYRLLAYAQRSDWSRYAGDASASLSSFERVTDRSVLDVQPLRLEVVTLSEPMSLTRFHERTGVPIEVEELARLNRSAPGAVLSAGTRVKTVVGTPVG